MMSPSDPYLFEITQQSDARVPPIRFCVVVVVPPISVAVVAAVGLRKEWLA